MFNLAADCGCLCECCKAQNVPDECLYQPIKEISLNDTYKQLTLIESTECAKHTLNLTKCRQECVMGRNFKIINIILE